LAEVHVPGRRKGKQLLNEVNCDVYKHLHSFMEINEVKALCKIGEYLLLIRKGYIVRNYPLFTDVLKKRLL
jgi:hypothetical protein